MAEFELSSEQRAAVQAARNLSEGFVFITGKAGVGKSVVLREVRSDNRTIVLAPTGLAAVNVGGQTMHSFLGIRPGPINLKEIRLGFGAKQALKGANRIVIDEVAMVRSDLMDALDAALRGELDKSKPFGGMPIVAFGDVYQIEPIVESTAERQWFDVEYRSPFFFDSQVLAPGFPAMELRKVFRQSDQGFIGALNQIREGDADGLDYFEGSVRAPSDTALFLTFKNATAAAQNAKRLAAVRGETKAYNAQVRGEWSGEPPAERALNLKVGARVMVTANHRPNPGQPSKYSNGDMGEVIELSDHCVKVVLDSGETHWLEPRKWEKLKYTYQGGSLHADIIAEFEQLPLKLGYAATVHKAQGQTFDECHLALDMPAFAHGQVYVALSRCRTPRGLSLGRKLMRRDLIVNPRVLAWGQENLQEVQHVG